jgi:hypothetical protein
MAVLTGYLPIMMENVTSRVIGTAIEAGGNITIAGTGTETGILIGIETETMIGTAASSTIQIIRREKSK